MQHNKPLNKKSVLSDQSDFCVPGYSRTYIAIDLKSFYASVECRERGLDPLNTNLVVADVSRTEKTICLAVSPSLKAYGIPGRARLFEVIQKVREVNARRKNLAPGQRLEGSSWDACALKQYPNLEVDYLAVPPRMSLYVTYSTRIYEVYLKYIAPEDIHVYSIDEVMMDVTDYLATYRMTAEELARKMILDVQETVGITATAGIGTNLYLCKVAMDIVSKHIQPDENGVRIATLDERSYRRLLWDHRPLRDFWRVRRSWRPTGCIPWVILPGVPSESRRSIIMRNCCTGCLASMPSFSSTMPGAGSHVPLRISRSMSRRTKARCRGRC